MMTKKHFEAFARKIRESTLDGSAKVLMASVVVNVATNDNPRFDDYRFRRACGLVYDEVYGWVSE